MSLYKGLHSTNIICEHHASITASFDERNASMLLPTAAKLSSSAKLCVKSA